MPLSGTRAEQRLNAASVHSVGKGGGAQGQSPPAPLAGTGATTHMRFMPNGLKSRSHISEPLRLCLLGLGAALVAVSPAVGVIPGPGGIIVFAIGLALVLKNSQWAKKRYIWLKRRWPRLGRMADRGLGRRQKKPRGD